MARVAVIGAGFVGLSSAYWLVRDGHQVTLYDPAGAAGGASFGNAGTFASYACIPVNNPTVFRDLPRYLFSSASPLRLRVLVQLRLPPPAPDDVEAQAGVACAQGDRCVDRVFDLLVGDETADNGDGRVRTFADPHRHDGIRAVVDHGDASSIDPEPD